MVQLDALPGEILHNVLSNLKHRKRHVLSSTWIDVTELRKINHQREESATTLSKLCLVSKTMQKFAEEYLYETWETRIRPNGKSTLELIRNARYYQWDDAQQRSLQRFLLTIVLHSHLAKHVKYIEAAYW